MQRLILVFQGQTLTLYTLGRVDLLGSKIFALCDRGEDLQDCLALKPSLAELREALVWVTQQDANPGWPAHVETTVRNLAERLGYEF